jgi:surface antigen
VSALAKRRRHADEGRGQRGRQVTDGRGDVLRRTTIELGPLRITREYRCAPLHPHYPFADASRARGGGGWRAAGVLGVVLALSAGGLSMAATHAPPRTPRYSVSLPVPQRVIAPAGAVRATQRAAPLPVSTVAATTAAAMTADAEESPADAGSRTTAIAAALRSGEVQEWFEAAGQVHGFVVAGAAEQDGAQTCRALSILTRAPGGADRVDQRRACLPVG